TQLKSNCPPSEYQGTCCILYHNEGGGRFSNATRRAGAWPPGSKALTAVVVDYNDDGWPDLYVGNDGTPAYLLRNERNGRFRERGLRVGVALAETGAKMAAMGVDFGDYENNGRQDLFVADFQDVPNHLFENLGHETFVDVSSRTGVGEPGIPFLG